MRVLLVADVVGGVRTFVAELTSALTADQQVKLHLALLGPEHRAAELEAIGAQSLEVRELALEWMESCWEDVQATGDWIELLTERHRPDVVHINTFAPVRTREVPVMLSVHSCVLSWWRAVHGEDAPAHWERYRQLALAALRRADLLTVPTRALLESLGSIYGPLPPARVIANGRRIEADTASVEKRERLVVSGGRLWDPAKNVDSLARAAPAIDGQVVLFGPGRGREESVAHTGELDEAGVVGWLTRAAVFAEPARYEPFGLTALEAALCGCALVLGDIPSLREVWGDAAVYVDPDDPGALAAAVNTLLGDPAARARAAQAARARARRYQPQAMADAYLRAYESLLPARVPA